MIHRLFYYFEKKKISKSCRIIYTNILSQVHDYRTNSIVSNSVCVCVCFFFYCYNFFLELSYTVPFYITEISSFITFFYC